MRKNLCPSCHIVDFDCACWLRRFSCVGFGCKAWLCDNLLFRLIRDFRQFCVALENFALCRRFCTSGLNRGGFYHSTTITAPQKIITPKSHHSKIKCLAKSAQIAQNFGVICAKFPQGFCKPKPPPKSKKTIK